MKKNIDIWTVILSSLMIVNILFIAMNMYFVFSLSENINNQWEEYTDEQKYFVGSVGFSTIQTIYNSLFIFCIVISLFVVFIRLRKLEKIGEMKDGTECNGKQIS